MRACGWRIECGSIFIWVLRQEWVDFIHIWYCNQLPCVADACQIAFGSKPNLSNLWKYLFLKFYVFVAISHQIS